jgi:monooxygenase
MTASWQARIATFIVRRRVKPALGDMSDLARVRRVFDSPLPWPRGVRFREAAVGGIRGEWVEAEQGGEPRTTLMYIHGGGFVGCSPRTHRPLTAAFALKGMRAFVPDYRLAPEHPFPAALDDVLAAWRGLRSEQESAASPSRLVVAGDSAGGNLSIALMIALRHAGEPLPDAAALLSPATDLTGGSASLTENSERDAMFIGLELGNLARPYVGTADPANPLISPLLADLHGLPPMLVHVGNDEALRDDSIRLAEKARAAGVEVSLQVWPTVPHVWQLLWRLPEARRSVAAAARFLHEASSQTPEHLDVAIIGAGLSGIGAAAHLQECFPDKRYAVLESRDAIGGTWDLFRYPGIRSDSDMYTLGYSFKPWPNPKAIADGPSIRAYVSETAHERGIDRQIRFGHRVVSADWSSADACWHLIADRVDAQGGASKHVHLRANFLWVCSGYYSYTQGHRPPFANEAQYRGTLVHPQFWPESLNHAGKRVLVIGSGATAVTLVPEMAKTAAHVTMLQRSPSYVVALPSRDAIAEALKRVMPAMWAYRIVRAKNVLLAMLFFKLSRRWPQQVKERLVREVKRQVGPGHDVDANFNPRYKPWDQRVCIVPDGDLFKSMRDGRASVVTGEIETFTETGVRLVSGETVDADIVVTATGLQLNLLGDVALSVDGVRCDFAKAMAYKGMMFSGVPNLVYTFGYTNASWTLKADLTSRYVCRLLEHMDRHGYASATPKRDPAVQEAPFLDFSSGYVQRAIHLLPKQGATRPWRVYQNYVLDLLTLRYGAVADGTLQFTRGSQR